MEGPELRHELSERWNFHDDKKLNSVLLLLESVELGRSSLEGSMGILEQILGVYCNDKHPEKAKRRTSDDVRRDMKPDPHPRNSVPMQEGPGYIPLKRDDAMAKQRFEEVMGKYMQQLGHKPVAKRRKQSVVVALVDAWTKRKRKEKIQEEVKYIDGIINELRKIGSSTTWSWKKKIVDGKEIWYIDSGASAIYVPTTMRRRLKNF